MKMEARVITTETTDLQTLSVGEISVGCRLQVSEESSENQSNSANTLGTRSTLTNIILEKPFSHDPVHIEEVRQPLVVFFIRNPRRLFSICVIA